MNRSLHYLAAVLGIAGGNVAAPLRAADEETQFWLTGVMATRLADDVAGTFELSRRIREGDDQIVLRGNADFRLTQAASVGAGAAYLNAIEDRLDAGEDREIRLHQQLTLSVGRLSFRTRVEERFFADANSLQLRVRQRVQASHPVADGVQGAVSGEVFYVAYSSDGGQSNQVSQWRLNGTATYKLTPMFEAAVGYLIMYTPVVGSQDKLAHIPQLTLTYRP